MTANSNITGDAGQCENVYQGDSEVTLYPASCVLSEACQQHQVNF